MTMHGYVPLVVNTSRSFPGLRLITGFVTRLSRLVPLVEQNCLPFRFLVGFMCMFCRSLFVLLFLVCLFFDIRILITPFWYLQT
jgi:hypothetical protein